jgi:hypothetical protein
MAQWPDVEEAVNLLDIGDLDWIHDHLQHSLDAAIEQVKIDVAGSVAEFDDPDNGFTVTEKLRQASLRAVAVMRVNAPDDGWRALHDDHIYKSLMFGHRRAFGIA